MITIVTGIISMGAEQYIEIQNTLAVVAEHSDVIASSEWDGWLSFECNDGRMDAR
jgi:hypothetical protein